MKEKLENLLNLLNNRYYKIAIIDKKHKYEWLSQNPDVVDLNINLELSKSLQNNESNISAQMIIQNLFQENEKQKLYVFYNFEMLFRQEFRFDFISFLKEKSKIQKIAIIWPGQVQEGQLIYSRSDRPDYYTHTIDNYLIYEEDK